MPAPFGRDRAQHDHALCVGEHCVDIDRERVLRQFHARQPEQDAWKADVLAGRVVLEELETEAYDLYAHQNEDIVRLTPEQLKQRMAEKERAAQGA